MKNMMYFFHADLIENSQPFAVRKQKRCIYTPYLQKFKFIECILCCRSCLSTYSEVCVVPHHIDVYGVLVESEELLNRSRVVSDEQTLGYKIASFVNKFSVSII